ncbi:formate/nitrite transporter family protein [Cohnella hashimotonis]|uniref:Formate/nitrite transporter family protein n=1 Tax=Cohnella hashimotonis TaxID=2826895 RepID=A0ABT6TL11_9BACL|nr:formate/nitrite transporter family protein [Cohnella hashimotonis]MDI4647527.1 formate/nitrite transporter family protein [Cohnella hashimotonis]
MDYVKPGQMLENLIAMGVAKSKLPVSQKLVRSGLAGAILGCATTLAYTASVQTKLPIAGAILFPIGFVLILLLGLELVTGSFAAIPLALLKRRISTGKMVSSFAWALVGHVIGAGLYAALYTMAVTKMGHEMSNPLVQAIISAAEGKTTAYIHIGADGWMLAFVKAVLCNWMVALGVVMSLSSTSTIGKIAAMWMPVLLFFGQGFEHLVVNMFLLPAGLMLGANYSFADMLLWNWIPVLLGNFAGGAICTGLLFYLAHRERTPEAVK